MNQPHGFADRDTTLVCKLNRVIYGLKSAPRVWYDKLHHALIQFGFVASKCDHSLLVYNHQGVTLYALVYVYDILIIGTTLTLVHDLITKLHVKFSLKQLRIPKYFIGIEVNYYKNGSILLDLTHTTQKILRIS